MRERRRDRRRARAPPRRAADRGRGRLLDLDLGALLLEGGLDLLGLVLGDAFLDGLGRRVDEVLGLLEAEAGELADDLDDRDLVRADLGQGRGELGLLLGGGGGLGGGAATGGRGGGDRDRGGGGDAVALLERLMNSDSSRTVILSMASRSSSWVMAAMVSISLVGASGVVGSVGAGRSRASGALALLVGDLRRA